MLSDLQRSLLDLASNGERVSHAKALEVVFCLSRVAGRRGRLVFDWTDPATKTARTTLHRSIDRLVARGLVVYVPHGYKLSAGSSATTATGER